MEKEEQQPRKGKSEAVSVGFVCERLPTILGAPHTIDELTRRNNQKRSRLVWLPAMDPGAAVTPSVTPVRLPRLVGKCLSVYPIANNKEKWRARKDSNL